MMNWFVELMELIDQYTGLGNLSYLIGGAIVILFVALVIF